MIISIINLKITSLHETAGTGLLTELLVKSKGVASIGLIRPLMNESINKATSGEI